MAETPGPARQVRGATDTTAAAWVQGRGVVISFGLSFLGGACETQILAKRGRGHQMVEKEWRSWEEDEEERAATAIQRRTEEGITWD
jgi:hypothetical protein